MTLGANIGTRSRGGIEDVLITENWPSRLLAGSPEPRREPSARQVHFNSTLDHAYAGRCLIRDRAEHRSQRVFFLSVRSLGTTRDVGECHTSYLRYPLLSRDLYASLEPVSTIDMRRRRRRRRRFPARGVLWIDSCRLLQRTGVHVTLRRRPGRSRRSLA